MPVRISFRAWKSARSCLHGVRILCSMHAGRALWRFGPQHETPRMGADAHVHHKVAQFQVLDRCLSGFCSSTGALKSFPWGNHVHEPGF